jgi:ubiquitin carboxyl-terminal hydrolase 25/28
LHAICVHDGGADDGHYFTFIRDHCNKKWIKMNDIKISEVTEEEVFAQCVGGHGNMTAYWLVYVNEEVRDQLATTNVFTFDASE